MDPSRTWQRFRALPTWLQVVAWVLAWPALAALALWRLDPGRPIARAAAAAILLGGGVLWLAVLVGPADGPSTPSSADGRAEASASDTPSDTSTPAAPSPTAGDGDPSASLPAAPRRTPSPTPTPSPSPPRPPSPTPTAVAAWVVTDIVDGDTLDVVGPAGDEERVRIVGIDTPERGECGYAEAADALAGLVLGHDVELVSGAVDDRDAYGRLLRYVDVQGTDAGLTLIEAGLAIARYDSRDGYGRHPREDDYVAADAATPHRCAVPLPSPTAAPAPVPPDDGSDGTAAANPWGADTCHPAYDPCVPPPSAVGDLDCPDIRAAYPGGVSVDPAHGDPHRLDGDGDGHGCE